jgi:hypothetical protein
MLQKRGRYFDSDPDEDELARDHPLLAACYAASLQGTVTLGERAGQLLLRVGTTPERGAEPAPDSSGGSSIPTPGYGFDLHAGVRISAGERKALERLCRYVARGPIAGERLSLGPDGTVVYRLRRPWRDGTVRLVFEPHDFISKVLPLMWAPYVNRVRYFGILAPNARLRGRVVPDPSAAGAGPRRARRPRQLALRGTGKAARAAGARREDQRRAARRPDEPPRHRYTWSELIARSFAHGARCPRCLRGQLRVVATVTNPAAIDALLGAVGIRSPEVPRSHPPRAPPRAPPPSPQLELPFGVAGRETGEAA